MNFYNEIDPFAAAWLRELIKSGYIAPGVVDERSIEDIRPDELKNFTQCHFFAGIGVWSYALRQAGWPDYRPIWTGSCPCQPFSVAGQKRGVTDERHLWPAFYHLIQECRPNVVLGEQVEAAIREGWIDLVQTDLEGIGYSFGAAGLPAAGFGAPHIRARLYFAGSLGDTLRSGLPEQLRQRNELPRPPEAVLVGELANTADAGRQRRRASETCDGDDAARIEPERLRPVSGFWGAAEWLHCRDEKFRAIEPGTFPLAHGASARVGRLRGYGNAIVAPVAEAFITAVMETLEAN